MEYHKDYNWKYFKILGKIKEQTDKKTIEESSYVYTVEFLDCPDLTIQYHFSMN